MDLKEALIKAIQAERYGYSFYMMAARSTDDAKGREIFETLAAEELNHMHFLSEQYNSFAATGKANLSIKLGGRRDLSGSSPIFSDNLKARIRDAHYEMSALAIGIQLELDSMNFYKTQAEEMSDPEIKKFFTELAEWETSHYDALLRQQESLKGDYWSSAGFAPF